MMRERSFFFKLEDVSISSDITMQEDACEGLIHLICGEIDVVLTPLHCEMVAGAFIRAHQGNCRYPAMETSAFFAFDKNFGNKTMAVRISVSALNSEASIFKILVILDNGNNMIVRTAIFTSEAVESLTMMLLDHKNLDFLPSCISGRVGDKCTG